MNDWTAQAILRLLSNQRYILQELAVLNPGQDHIISTKIKQTDKLIEEKAATG